MTAGSRDRPSMVATRRYAQWQSRFMRYVDTKSNADALRKCMLQVLETLSNITPENKAHYDAEKEAIHLILTEIEDDIFSTVDACKTAHEMWITIERLQHDTSPRYKNDIQTRQFRNQKTMIVAWARAGEDNSSHKKIESLSSKKTKEMSKQKPEYVMDAVYVLLADREEKKGGHKEGRPLSAPVKLCFVVLCWSLIRKQRV
nr:hypothetical protein [Tanacetum cinerariifolium]